MFMESNGAIFKDKKDCCNINDFAVKEYKYYECIITEDDTVSSALHKYLKEANISERTLSKETGIPHTTMQRYLKENSITIDILSAIIIYLELCPRRQRQLFTLAHYLRPDGSMSGYIPPNASAAAATATNQKPKKRSEIIGDFLDVCFFGFGSLAECNRSLHLNHFKPLTNVGIDNTLEPA